MKVAVVGGGAAGFFAAIHAKENHPNSSVHIFEKSQKLLTKVKVSGGGRCNITNGADSISELARGYPRGEKQVKKAFSIFNNRDTVAWFETRGVELYTQADNRVFPTSDDSQTIIDCLLRETAKLGIQIHTGVGVSEIEHCEEGITLHFASNKPQKFSKVIIATGGSPKRSGFHWLESLGHEITEPVPSLFTFNMPNEPITELMGVVADKALVTIQGTKLKSKGPLLITHWGMSGPAVLKLSAFGARVLSEMNYTFNIKVNWVGEPNHELIAEALRASLSTNPNKQISNIKPFTMADRLWQFLLQRSEIPDEKKANELSKKQLNRLVNVLTNDEYAVRGKTTFKEEFVICGGVSLSSVNLATMQSKVVPNIYFAGEVLDIDGITGGYNFQAAWTTGFIAGKLL